MSSELALSSAPAASLAIANRNVPAFLVKLFTMVNDHSTDDLIRWNASGTSFLVLRHEDFAKELLPRFYKHNNFSSFVRQLNMYGFHKIPHIEDNAASKTQMQTWEFSNPNFLRDQPDMLCLVTRKKSGESGEKDSLDYQAIMSEIQAIKRHQTTISQDLKRIQADNQALWQEQIDTRARHSKHQETIEKILTFLGTVYGNQYNHDDKSLQSKPKKRKLLLQDETSDTIEELDRQDERINETFEDMFRSASTSPKLRPLRQPATGIASDRTKTNGTPSENRFTMPQFEARQQQMAPTSMPPSRSRNKINNEAQSIKGQATSSPVHNKISSIPSNTPPADRNTDILDRNSLDLSSALSPLDTSNPSHPSNMQLTPSMQSRIAANNHRAQELQDAIAQQDQNIGTLAAFLGMDANMFDDAAPDMSLFNDVGDGTTYDDYLDSNAFAATPQDASTQGLDFMNGEGVEYPYTGTKYEMNPPLYVPGTETNGTHTGVQNGKTESAGTTPSPAVSAPGSTTGSLRGDEEIEEIDMDRARGKKRKST